MSKIFIKQLMSCLIIGISCLGLSSSVFASSVLTCTDLGLLQNPTLVGSSDVAPYDVTVIIKITGVNPEGNSGAYYVPGTMDIRVKQEGTNRTYEEELNLSNQQPACLNTANGISLVFNTHDYSGNTSPSFPVYLVTLSSDPTTVQNLTNFAMSGDMNIEENNQTQYGGISGNFSNTLA